MRGRSHSSSEQFLAYEDYPKPLIRFWGIELLTKDYFFALGKVFGPLEVLNGRCTLSCSSGILKGNLASVWVVRVLEELVDGDAVGRYEVRDEVEVVCELHFEWNGFQHLIFGQLVAPDCHRHASHESSIAGRSSTFRFGALLMGPAGSGLSTLQHENALKEVGPKHHIGLVKYLPYQRVISTMSK